MKLDLQEISTILAALRFWQEEGLADDPEKRSDALHDIATANDACVSMDSAGIDDLCEKVNTLETDALNPAVIEALEKSTAELERIGNVYSADHQALIAANRALLKGA